VAVSPEWVEYLEAGIVQRDGAGPAELPCPGLGNHSRELFVERQSSPARQRQEPDRLPGALSGDGARDSQCRGNHRRRVQQIMRTLSDSPPDRHFVSRSGPRQRTKEGLLRRLPMPGVHSVLAIGTSDILRGPARPACHRAGMLASALRSFRKPGRSQPVDATPSDMNSFSKGGVYGTRKTGEAFH
jgi:hypothetical protein